jgi:gluconate kinase
VVLTFAIMGLFDGEEAFIRAAFPDIKFVYIMVDNATLCKRILERNVKFFAAMGTTQKDMWYHETNAEARKNFGEEYSEEMYEKFIYASFLEVEMIKIEHNPAKNCY